MIEYKMSRKYIILNILFATFIFIFYPFIELVVVLSDFHPSGSWLEYYWVKPFIFLIPMLYLVLAIVYLLFKKFNKSIFMFVLSVYVILGFFMWNHDKETFDNFRTVFSNIGIMKK